MRRECGSREEGFSWEFDERARALRIRAWGFWGRTVAATFPDAIIQACSKALSADTEADALELVVDAAALKPQRNEGQEAWAKLFGAMARARIRRVSIRTTALVRLQLMRLAKEKAMVNAIVFELVE